VIVITDKKNCVGCAACANKCPQKCIVMREDNEGFVYPNIDKDSCISCGLCEKVCPVLNLPLHRPVENVYACYNKDRDIREKSSSGGCFSLLAEHVLIKGGYVVGAAFDSDLSVHHIMINQEKDLALLRGSKYVQSKIGNIYVNVKGALETGKEVLFSGTPCQVAGLVRFLGKEYDNLFLVDVVCHGVPSPKVYRQRLKEIREKIGEDVVSVNFRDKTLGWHNFQLVFTGLTGCVKESKQESSYMRAFLSNMSVRPSCSVCHYNDEHSSADLTIADYWGVETKFPELSDNKGVTVVLVNTIKGNRLFTQVRKNAEVWNSDFTHASKYNFAMKNVSKQNPQREEFFIRLGTEKLDALTTELLKRLIRGNTQYICAKKR